MMILLYQPVMPLIGRRWLIFHLIFVKNGRFFFFFWHIVLA